MAVCVTLERRLAKHLVNWAVGLGTDVTVLIALAVGVMKDGQKEFAKEVYCVFTIDR